MFFNIGMYCRIVSMHYEKLMGGRKPADCMPPQEISVEGVPYLTLGLLSELILRKMHLHKGNENDV